MEVNILSNKVSKRGYCAFEINSDGKNIEEVKEFLQKNGCNEYFSLGIEINGWRMIFSSNIIFIEQMNKAFGEVAR